MALEVIPISQQSRRAVIVESLEAAEARKRIKKKKETKSKRKARAKKVAILKSEFKRATFSGKPLEELKKRPKRLVGTKQPGVKGISKLAQAFLPPGTLEGRPQVIGRSQAGVDSDRGRGRPTGTFKARYLPGVGVVRMPTAVFKRALSAQKAKIRLEEAKRQAGMRRLCRLSTMAGTESAFTEQSFNI